MQINFPTSTLDAQSQGHFKQMLPAVSKSQAFKWDAIIASTLFQSGCQTKLFQQTTLQGQWTSVNPKSLAITEPFNVLSECPGKVALAYSV